MLKDPKRVFNFDESHFLLARPVKGNSGKLQNFLEVSNENEKEGLTVLMGYSAARLQ